MFKVDLFYLLATIDYLLPLIFILTHAENDTINDVHEKGSDVHDVVIFHLRKYYFEGFLPNKSQESQNKERLNKKYKSAILAEPDLLLNLRRSFLQVLQLVLCQILHI